MTFEGQYLTYAEFQELGGSAIGLMPFNVLEFEARKQIDAKTLNRLSKVKTIPNEVKLCIFHIIQRVDSYNKSLEQSVSSDGSVASESIDGYSVNYNSVDATQIDKLISSKSAEFNDIISTDLFGLVVDGEHLVYCGVL